MNLYYLSPTVSIISKNFIGNMEFKGKEEWIGHLVDNYLRNIKYIFVIRKCFKKIKNNVILLIFIPIKTYISDF